MLEKGLTMVEQGLRRGGNGVFDLDMMEFFFEGM